MKTYQRHTCDIADDGILNVIDRGNDTILIQFVERRPSVPSQPLGQYEDADSVEVLVSRAGAKHLISELRLVTRRYEQNPELNEGAQPTQ